MKIFLIYLGILSIILSCVKSDREKASINDSLSVIDPIIPSAEVSIDTLQIINSLDSSTRLRENYSGNTYKLSIELRGFEGASEQVWIFDEKFNPLECRYSWGAEASDGQGIYLFSDNELVIIIDTVSNNTTMKITKFSKTLAPFTGVQREVEIENSRKEKVNEDKIVLLSKKDFDQKKANILEELFKAFREIKQLTDSVEILNSKVEIKKRSPVQIYPDYSYEELKTYSMDSILYIKILKDSIMMKDPNN